MGKKVISITTGKPVTSRKLTSIDAKRWCKLVEYLENGFAAITVAGVTLKRDEIDGLTSHLDDQVKEAENEIQKEKMRQRRKK